MNEDVEGGEEMLICHFASDGSVTFSLQYHIMVKRKRKMRSGQSLGFVTTSHVNQMYSLTESSTQMYLSS